MPIYSEEHVSHAWLVDPLLRPFEVFRREGANWLLLGTWRHASRVRAEPFEAVELELAALWAR